MASTNTITTHHPKSEAPRPPRKRCLLWDWTNTRDCPDKIDQLDFAGGPFCSVANWNAWVPPELKGRLPFRPTVRTPAQIAGEEWAWIRDGPHDTVHFFNEPERQQPELGPRRAAELWRAHMVGELRAQKGKRLVGPGCASDDQGRRWLDEFMALIAEDGKGGGGGGGGGPRAGWPDMLGVHYYGEDAGAAKAYIAGMHAAFGLPVVVSEIACTSRDAATVEAFTAELAAWMDAQDWVEEYAFFGAMRHVADDFVSPAAQLMDAEGNFTALMRMLDGGPAGAARGGSIPAKGLKV